MSEASIAFLYKAASLLPTGDINETQEKLKSYYRMRCKDISKGFGLPQKHFSEEVMCTHCCLEWRTGTDVKVKSIKLSKRQRKRIKSQKKLSNGDKAYLHSNEIIQTCTFCRHTTKTVALKPNKPTILQRQHTLKEIQILPKKAKENVNKIKKQSCDIYSNTVQVFSLNNKKNILKNTIKEPKIIKNNQKKKDKFAGLCQKAVLISAKLKQEKEKQNKLSLFLKPSL